MEGGETRLTVSFMAFQRKRGDGARKGISKSLELERGKEICVCVRGGDRAIISE